MRSVLRQLLLVLALMAPVAGCVGSPQPEPPTGGPRDGGQGGAVDAAPGPTDAGVAVDAGAGVPSDAGAAVDGGDAAGDGGIRPGPVVPRVPPGLPVPRPEPVELPPHVLAPPDGGG